MTIKPGPSEVHDILICVTKGMSNEKISRNHEVSINVVKSYRKAARYLLKKQTVRANRRLTTKRSEENKTYIPSKPLTPRERKQSRLYINGILNLVTDSSIDELRGIISYFANHVHTDELGIRFKSADKLNWFVRVLSPVISLRNWYVFVTTSEPNQSDVDDFMSQLKIQTRTPEVKIKQFGKPDFYLRLKHPNQDDLRRRKSSYQGTSMLKYVLFMASVMLSAESDF